jgi:hypothetical protein
MQQRALCQHDRQVEQQSHDHQRVALSDRISAARSGSTERTPTMVLTSIGKKMVSAQTRILLSRPVPNQITSNGARATIGTDCEATI